MIFDANQVSIGSSYESGIWFSGIDLRYEYEVAAPAAGLSPAQIRQAQRNALAVAFVSDVERQAILASKAAKAT